MTNAEQVPLYASAILVGGISTYDVYLIVVAAGILISSIIAVYNAVKSNKNVTIDSSTLQQLKEIDEKLKENKEEDNKEDK